MRNLTQRFKWRTGLSQSPWIKIATTAVILILAVAVFLSKRGSPPGMIRQSPHKDSAQTTVETAALPAPSRSAQLPPSPLNELLEPDLSPERQVRIVGQMLLDYWTTVRSLPTGTWDEVYSSLSGENKKTLQLIPRDHPALGPTGFQSHPDGPSIRIHVVSSRDGVFQLIHSGADATHFTDDDLICNFPPDLPMAVTH